SPLAGGEGWHEPDRPPDCQSGWRGPNQWGQFGDRQAIDVLVQHRQRSAPQQPLSLLQGHRRTAVRTRRRQSVQTMRRLIALLLFLASAAIHAEAFRLTTWNLDFRPQESAWSADG